MSVSYDRIDNWEVRSCVDGFGVFDDDTMISGPHLSRSEAIRSALELPKPLPPKLEMHRHNGECPEAAKVNGFRAEAHQVDRAPTLIASDNERLLHAEADRRVGATAR